MKNRHSPRVSVVLPTYNRGWTVNHAIDSVLGQDDPALELIVVDDGSTDDTPHRLAAYGPASGSSARPTRGSARPVTPVSVPPAAI